MKRRVVLVDDHGLFLAGVRAELGDAVEVVGEAQTVAEAVPLIKELDPDVVLLDVHLPDGSGDAIINAVAQDRPGVKFLALSVSDAAEDVIAVIRAGARGYVTKTIDADELAAAIERVAHGDAVFSPRLAGFVLDSCRDYGSSLAEPQLTPIGNSMPKRRGRDQSSYPRSRPCESRGRPWAASISSRGSGPSSGARLHWTTRRQNSPASTRTSPARTDSRCRRGSTMPCSGCPEAPTTSSSRSRARRSRSSRPWPRSRQRPRAGPISTTAI